MAVKGSYHAGVNAFAVHRTQAQIARASLTECESSNKETLNTYNEPKTLRLPHY
jgi:hypothetical protein